MFKYAMKAAAHSKAQISDRVNAFKRLRLAPIIELYLSGEADLFGEYVGESIKNCRSFSECEYIVHFPILDPDTGYIYDPYNNENEKLLKVLDFCNRINSKTIIMHRCYGFNQTIAKSEAEEKFLNIVAGWNRLIEGSDCLMLIENYGFVWLPAGFGSGYITSSLDHFFPWDIGAFNKKIKRMGLNNIGILLDTAHAVVSSNMFNIIKKHPELLSDGRFANIYPDDIDKSEHVRVEDFIFDFIDYFHVSDSFIWNSEYGTDNMSKYLYTENLPIGGGNVDYKHFFSDIVGDKTLIMEINPADGDHYHNRSQAEAIEFFKNIISDKGETVCA